MATGNFMESVFGAGSLFKDSYDYVLDSMQKSVLFMDVMRKRGNVYLDHIEKGQPPVLVFDYEIIIDGRNLDNPANYALTKIIDKRKRDAQASDRKEKRQGPQPSHRGPHRKRIITLILIGCYE